MINKSRVPRSRSRTGCFTCRKRRKKCDESDYPICKNCQAKRLNCQWPVVKQEFHKKLQQVRYIDNDNVPTVPIINHNPDSLKKNPILQMIGLQQDYVNGENNENDIDYNSNKSLPFEAQFTAPTMSALNTNSILPNPTLPHTLLSQTIVSETASRKLPETIVAHNVLSQNVSEKALLDSILSESILSQLTTLEEEAPPSKTNII